MQRRPLPALRATITAACPDGLHPAPAQAQGGMVLLSAETHAVLGLQDKLLVVNVGEHVLESTDKQQSHQLFQAMSALLIHRTTFLGPVR